MENKGSDKRSKNFSETEINILLSLVENHRLVIENKLTDQVSVRDKENSWKEIEKDFNQGSGLFFRDWKSLKCKYENLKKASKRKFADEKKYVSGTGGGPSKQSLITSMDLKIKSLLGDLPLVGQESRYDSDAAYITEIEVETEDAGAFLHQPMVENEDDFSTVLGEEIIDIPLEEHNYNAVKHNHSEQHPTTSGSLSVIKNSKAQLDSNKPAVQIYDKQFSVNKLKCKTSSPLKFKRKPTKSVLDRSVAGKKIETFSEAKSELIQLQKELAQKQLYFSEEEHKLNMKNLKLIEEKHLKKIKLIDLKIKNEEMKMKCVKETFNIL